jgi:sulfatase maturation enzyme AslB (radical SAM superfamily)
MWSFMAMDSTTMIGCTSTWHVLHLRVKLFMSSMTRQWNKKKKQRIHILNVSMLLQNMCFPRTICSSNKKTYMCNHVFLHLSERQVSEFRARWDKSTTVSMNSHHFNPTSAFWMKKPKRSFIPLFWSVGSLIMIILISIF